MRAELEKKRIVPENQAEFRRERGTVDNIYVLNYVINRNLSRREGGFWFFRGPEGGV